MVKKSKADKVWAYKIRHPQATTSEIAKATKTSYGLRAHTDAVRSAHRKKCSRRKRVRPGDAVQVLDTAKELRDQRPCG